MIARWLGTAVTVIVLVASGTYLLVYLYRWEWNRALVAGVFFVAAEVAIIGSALLRRLRAIETRLDEHDAATLAHIREAAPEQARPFQWLDPTQVNVFVPVLLGAGVILSVLAHAVERVAGATVTPIRERALAGRLSSISLPAGGLLGTGPAGGLGPLRTVHRPATTGWRSLAAKAFATTVAAFLVVVAIDLVADETQDRIDAPRTSGEAEVVVQIENRFTNRSQIRTAEALFVACRHMLSDRYRASAFTDLGAGRIAFTIAPDFGEHAERRFEGCLEDALFDRVSASVVRLDHRP